MNTQKRDINLDLIRAISIIMILIIHSLEDVEYLRVILGEVTIPNFKWLLETSLHLTCRLAVPMFCMLSGCLMGGRDIENYKEFFRARVMPLIRITFIWMLIYRILYIILYGKETYLNTKNIISEFIFFNPSTSGHLWYMPMIIGIYLAIPFINKLIKNCKTKDLLIFIGLNLIFFSVLPTISMLVRTFGILPKADSINTVIEYKFFGGIYVNYYIIGYLIYNRKFLWNIKKENIRFVMAITAIIALASQFAIYSLRYIIGENYFWYDNIYIYILSVGLFTLLVRRKFAFRKTTERVIVDISKMSFGIYLIHQFFMRLMTKFISFGQLSIWIRIVILVFSLCIISCIVIKIISLNKKLSKFIINLKM